MGKSTYLIKYAMLGGILYSAIITVYPNVLHAETKPRGIRLLSDINTISFTVENEGSPRKKANKALRSFDNYDIIFKKFS